MYLCTPMDDTGEHAHSCMTPPQGLSLRPTGQQDMHVRTYVYTHTHHTHTLHHLCQWDSRCYPLNIQLHSGSMSKANDWILTTIQGHIPLYMCHPAFQSQCDGEGSCTLSLHNQCCIFKGSSCRHAGATHTQTCLQHGSYASTLSLGNLTNTQT